MSSNCSGVDESGDIGQALVGAAPVAGQVGSEPALVALAGAMGTQRLTLAARHAGRLAACGTPAGIFAGERAFRCVDALELTALDGDGAAGDDLPFDHAAAELLLVLLSLLVTVEDLADRSVPPIDDAHAVVDARGLAEEDVASAPVLLQAHVGEVGAVGVDLRPVASGPELPEQRMVLVVLRQQCSTVFFLGLRKLLAEAHQLGDDGLLGWWRLVRILLQQAGDILELRELIRHHGMQRIQPHTPFQKGPRTLTGCIGGCEVYQGGVEGRCPMTA